MSCTNLLLGQGDRNGVKSRKKVSCSGTLYLGPRQVLRLFLRLLYVISERTAILLVVPFFSETL